MWFTLMGLPGALQTVDDNVDTLLTRATEARLARLDADITSRAAASSYTPTLATKIDTNLDGKISEIVTGEVEGDTLNKVTYTADDTWTVPVGFKGFVFITMCGAGGAGGDDISGGGGGGGGAGGVCYRWPIWIDKSVTSSVTITVGDGGTAGGGVGGVGGNTSFGSFLTAYGGGGGGENSTGGEGGEGGNLFEAGISDAGAGAGSAETEEWVLPPLFPAYRNMRAGFHSKGGEGGQGGDGAVGDYGGHINISTNDWWQLFDGEGTNPIPDGENGDPTTSWGGGGGGGYGDGGFDSTAPEANGGGGGYGADDGGAASDGADGKLIIEYWN